MEPPRRWRPPPKRPLLAGNDTPSFLRRVRIVKQLSILRADEAVVLQQLPVDHPAPVFPPDQHDRFVNSVTRGKNQMPPWGDFFKPDQLEALWAYVMAGER